MINRYPEMTELARTFPVFKPGVGWREKVEAPGVEPWDAVALEEVSRPWSHGERCAVLFLLSVFNHADWPQFNMHEALGVWDDGQRAAFVAWAQNPWWP